MGEAALSEVRVLGTPVVVQAPGSLHWFAQRGALILEVTIRFGTDSDTLPKGGGRES